jgi:hypothetical protein
VENVELLGEDPLFQMKRALAGRPGPVGDDVVVSDDQRATAAASDDSYHSGMHE